ncbi:MAG: hypothetical protein NZL96_01110 [Patescibacteria group bacterium]|nr:hypothetical protein [Patescibacteria group bacterium]
MTDRRYFFRLIAVLFVSFFLSDFLVTNFFFSKTPIIDDSKIKRGISEIRNSVKNLIGQTKKIGVININRGSKRMENNNHKSSSGLKFSNFTLTPVYQRPSPTFSPTSVTIPASPRPTGNLISPAILPMVTPYSLNIITPFFTSLPTSNSITQQPVVSPPNPTQPPPKRPPVMRLSNSKLGMFYLVNFTPGGEKILLSGPRVIKFIDPYANPKFMEAIQKYRSLFQGGTVVLRFWQNTSGINYKLTDDPVRSAEDFFNQVMIPNYQVLGEGRYLFDYVHTPNEAENTPQWSNKNEVDWNGRFWLRLSQLNKRMGMKTCVPGALVGTPRPENLEPAVDDLVEIYQLGGAFCYHAYSDNYNKDLNYELNWSLLYRQIHVYLKTKAPVLANMPIILSEGGIAENWNPYGGFLKNNNVEKYKDWLVWFDARLKEDPYLIGVTLFQIGNNSDWAVFNHELIADWFSEYLRNN